MATETPISLQAPVFDEGNEQVKPTKPETVSEFEGSGSEGEKLKDMEVPSQSIPSSEPVSNAVKGPTTAEPPFVTPVKQEEQPVEAAEEKVKVEMEKPKVVGAPGLEEQRQQQFELTDKPKIEVAAKQEEKPKTEKPKEQSIEATEKVQDPVANVPTKESKAVAVQDTDDRVALSKEVETPKLVPQPQVKPEEQSAITKQDEGRESAIPEVQVKPEGEYGVAEQVETKSKDENPVPVKVKTETIDTLEETVKDGSREVQDSNLEKDDIKEQVAQPIKADVAVTEKSFEAEKTDGVEPPLGDKTEENAQEKTKVTETAKELEELGLGAKTNENEAEKEKGEELAQSNVQNKKNDDDSEATGELPKPTQKQSSNFFAKVKQSLAKAKKAITGRSPNPKTESSDIKG